ncbi:MAG: glycine C-acetyltransferase [Bacteroidota bacterium]
MARSEKLVDYFRNEIEELWEADLYKEERFMVSPQNPVVRVREGGGAEREVVNFCANNYLGLSSHPGVMEAAREALEGRGYGMSSVRFICGTQDKHRLLEERIARFLGMEDAILYSSCFDANTGLFETLLGEEDAVISDELNHASIIDGIRLCKAERRRYKHMDMADLERHLREARTRRFRMVATDGVFSMDGDVADLDSLCTLAERYDALVMVDDSHATGFLGKTGRGTPELRGVGGRVDMVSTTFGKALGGASGGCVAGNGIFIEVLRQRSRPYLFSNSLSPVIVAATLKALDILESSTELRDRLERNTLRFRTGMRESGFEIREGFHPIVPVMLHDASLVQEMARRLFEEGIYVVGFFYPVVPRGKARIRVQISAAHETGHIDRALEAFRRVGKDLGVIKERTG